MYRVFEALVRNTRAVDRVQFCYRRPALVRHQCSSKIQDDSKSASLEDEQKRFNPLEIQMLSTALHIQVFYGKSEAYDSKTVKICQQHLGVHNLWGKTGSVLPDVDFQLPPLHGSNIDEHFRKIAEEQSRPYFEKAQLLAQTTLSAIPDEWSFSPGWTKYVYGEEGVVTSSVDVPGDDALIFDVEVCMKEGPFPVIAVAVSPKAWYSWVSPSLVEDKNYNMFLRPSPKLYIPLELPEGQEWSSTKWKERLVVGHSVGFDRSFVKEQYYIKGPKTYFLDTLSLHMCISGLTSLQRNLWESAKAGRIGKVPWMLIGSGNKLVDLHHLYCGGDELDKSLVKIFVDGTLDDVRANFQDLVTYCAHDTAATQEVFAALWPKFLDRFPHPVSFAGMLEMGSAYLPVDRSWENYIRDADDTYEDLEKEMKCSLMKLADETCNYLHGKRYEQDPWLWELDWSVQDIRTKNPKPPKKTKKTESSSKGVNEDLPSILTGSTGKDVSSEVLDDEMIDDNNIEVVEGLKNSSDILARIPPAADVMWKRRQKLPGYPNWYRSLCMGPSDKGEWKEGPVSISPQCQVAPTLLRMTWDGFPLLYNRKHGWGYLVPGRTDNLTSSPMTLPSNEEDLVDPQKQELVFPTRAFDNLWKKHSMNVTPKETNESDSKFDDDELNVYSISEDQLWDRSELEEMRATKTLTTKKISPNTENLNETIEGDSESAPAEKVPRVKSTTSPRADSRPDFYHGVGPYNDVNLPGVWFFRIPHKNGENYRCGNPLAKDYISKMEDGTLVSSSGDHSAHKTLIINKMISSWRNAQKRVRSQQAVWFDKTDLPPEITGSEKFSSDEMYGAILPRVITAGTVTRRAVEPTWMTATNPREDRVGSELKAMVRAPPGYCLVGADVDSQELWIAAILGDAHFAGIHGSTAFGWMTLQGKKSEGTDLHSKTAETIGISRDHAKIFNYGRIYGAGQKYAEKLLLQFNHRLTEIEAKQKAETLFSNTKGVAKLILESNGDFVCCRFLLTDFGREMAQRFGVAEDIDENGCVVAKVYYQLLRKTARRRRESEMFNMLESIAQSMEPRTPVLDCRISKSLEPSAVGTEVRYLVSRKDKYRAALALQITNLLTRAMFAHKLGMNDLPQSVAFFSAVDIDTVLRKEVSLDCKTPSNPLGLHKGQGISPGL
ncbi:DNA polymerase subunit gamma-1 [Stylophora pistillata]|uniref:DNA polymerase subunit gamma-1 n=1 Tax=Stylophora pistillata TaxID=50429 RepID=A0A2B4RK64_STYPI|nr:DNA polymerase subunit gamma-1 [Stylophora pistillata]